MYSPTSSPCPVGWRVAAPASSEQPGRRQDLWSTSREQLVIYASLRRGVFFAADFGCLRARWRCAHPSDTVVARAVVRLASLRRWCAYPSTAAGARCGAGLLRWPARVRLYVHGPGTLHVHEKKRGGWRRGALSRWCLCFRALGDYSVCLSRRRNSSATPPTSGLITLSSGGRESDRSRLDQGTSECSHVR